VTGASRMDDVIYLLVAAVVFAVVVAAVFAFEKV
jgi:hypothetical protein